MIHSVARRFSQHSASTAILRFYHFLSSSIEQLEKELERHQQEREILYDHLFENRTFCTRFQPLLDEFRQRQMEIHRAIHPYSRPTNSPTPVTTNNPPSNAIPGTKGMPILVMDDEDEQKDRYVPQGFPTDVQTKVYPW
jgi:hypothetical protein